MAAAITRTLKRGGSVVIPAFAVDRTEVLLKALRTLQDQQRIPVAPIHVDSPMALAGMRVYVSAIQDGDPEINTATVAEGPDAIDLPNLHEATTPQESMALDQGGARIIVSASGHGQRRTRHPPPQGAAARPRRTPCCSWASRPSAHPGGSCSRVPTRSRSTASTSPVRAEIVEIEAFSVHADASELHRLAEVVRVEADSGLRQPRRGGRPRGPWPTASARSSTSPSSFRSRESGSSPSRHGHGAQSTTRTSGG